MHLSVQAQRQAKRTIVLEALKRTAGVEWTAGLPIVTAGEPVGYRRRIRLHVDRDGAVGYYQAGTHSIVAIEHCLVAEAGVNDVLRAVVGLEPPHRAHLAKFERLDMAVGDRSAYIHLTPRRRTTRAQARAARSALADALDPIRVTSPRHAGDALKLALAGQHLLVPSGAFFQVNWSVNQAIVSAVLDAAERLHLHTFCDVYCGAGNFSLPLLGAGLTGVGFDRTRSAISSAGRAAKAQRLRGEFLAGDAREVIQQLAKAGRRFDMVVLDPPRAGAKDVIRDLPQLRPKYVLMCACDPVTFARDAKLLADNGAELVELTAFDMFPQTHHVEVLGLFRVSDN